MNKGVSLFKDTMFYSLANWGRRIVTFITAPVIIAYLSPSEFGYISLVTTLASFCSIIGLLAVADQGLPRFFIDAESEAKKKGYAATSILMSGLGIAAISLVTLASVPLIPIFFESIASPLIFSALVICMCLSQSIYYVGSNLLKWSFQSPLFTKISLFQALAGAAVTIAGVVLLDFKSHKILMVTIISSLIAGGWANYAVRKYYDFSFISKEKMRELFKYSWPLLGLSVFAFFTRSLDRIFLGSLASMDDLGVFSVSSAVASVFDTVIAGFLFAWGPYILSTFKESWAPRKYADYFGVIAGFGITCIVILGLWGGPVLGLIRPDNSYINIGVYIPWIISASLLYYLGGYFTPGPTIRKQTHWKMLAFMLSAAINAALNYTLIPLYGVLGAGIASTAASLAAGIFNLVVSNKLYYVPNRWKFSFVYILFVTILISVIQRDEFAYNINNSPFVMRGVTTLILASCGALPFYKEIKSSGVVVKLVDKAGGIFRQKT